MKISNQVLSVTVSVLSLGTSVSQVALAEGSGAHGGDAVVCFSIPVDQAMSKGIMTARGRKAITSAVTNEYQQYSSRAAANPAIARLQKMSFEDALTELHAMAAGVPAFFAQLEAAQKYIGQIDDGLPAENGIEDVRDSGTGFGMPEGCDLVQAALRREDQMSYDPDVWKAFSGFQRALMQLHEEVYYIGVQSGQQDSTRTQLLIGYLLQEGVTDEGLVQKLQRYGFLIRKGSNEIYRTIKDFRSARDALLAQYDQALQLMREFIALPLGSARKAEVRELIWKLGDVLDYSPQPHEELMHFSSKLMIALKYPGQPYENHIPKAEADRAELSRLF